MQDKEKFYNSSPMKEIKLKDIFNHPKYSTDRNIFYQEMFKDLFLGFYRAKEKKMQYNFLPKVLRGTIQVKEEYTNIYEFTKLHWLVHDFKVNGISFKPQGFLQKEDPDQFACEIHPGTYRFFALLVAGMYDESIIVADRENYFPDIPELSYEEHLQLVNEGFIRERVGSYTEIETTQRQENVFTNHENSNHHDWNIIIQLEELAKIYTNLTIYTDDINDIEKLDLLAKENLEIKTTNQGYVHIPHKENYEGVSVYIPKSENMEDVFTFDMLLQLDLDTDIVYFVDTGVTIINNGSIGCKRLISQIIEESKPEYLNNFLWARRVVRI
jgi:hypothetical protein